MTGEGQVPSAHFHTNRCLERDPRVMVTCIRIQDWERETKRQTDWIGAKDGETDKQEDKSRQADMEEERETCMHDQLLPFLYPDVVQVPSL